MYINTTDSKGALRNYLLNVYHSLENTLNFGSKCKRCHDILKRVLTFYDDLRKNPESGH